MENKFGIVSIVFLALLVFSVGAFAGGADTFAPSTTLTVSPLLPTGVNDWYISPGPVSVDFSALDNGGGTVTQTNVEIDQNPTFSGDCSTLGFYSPGGSDGAITLNGLNGTTDNGENWVHYCSIDDSGNLETVQNVRVLVDLYAPVTQANAPATANNSTFQIPVSIVENGSGFDNISLFVSKDGGTWEVDNTALFNSDHFDFTATGDGNYDFYTVASDSASNIEATPGTADSTTVVTIPPILAAVNLGTAGNFVILTKSGISTTGTTSIVGNIGVSPIDSTAITGFGLIMDASNQFATSSLVTGNVYAADYTPPTPSDMTTAVSDMETAYTDAAGRTLPDYTELGAGNIGGMTLTPGLYKWGTGVTIPTDLTLSGGPTDIWIFQIAQTLNVGNGVHVTLSGGALPKNVFWQVAGQATLGTTSDFKGIILSQTAIVMNNGATLNGRALAQTAVTLIANTVIAPTSGLSDTSPPIGQSLALDDDSGFNNTGTVHATLTPGTDDTGIVGCQISWDDGATWEPLAANAIGADKALIDGDYVVRYQCMDATGNFSSIVGTNITVDTAAPITTITMNSPSGDNDWYVSPVDVMLTATDVFDANPTISFLVDQDPVGPATCSFDFYGGPFTIDGILYGTQGVNYIHYCATDAAGNQETVHTEQINLDTIFPVLNVDTNTIVTTDGTEVDFSATVDDANPTAPVWTFSHNFCKGVCATLTGYNVTYEVPLNGIFTVMVTETDDAGNSVSKTITMIAGSASFSPSADSNVDMNFGTLPAGSFTVNASESGTTPFSTSGFLVGGQFFELTSSLPNGTFSVTLTFSYLDATNDGIVDGTSINESELNVYFWNGTGWTQVTPDVVDTVANTISVTVDHFTTFATMTPAPAPAAPPANNGGSGGGGGGGIVFNSPNGASTNTVTPPATTTPPATNPTTTPAANPTPAATGTPTAPANPPVTQTTTPLTGFSVLGVSGNTLGYVLLAIGAIIAVFGIRGTWKKR